MNVMEIMAKDMSQIIDLAKTSQKYVAPMFNVQGYGAKGDGVTDDTAAIMSAISAATTGSIVWFPDGTYLHNGINVNKPILLTGSGILKPKNSASQTFVSITASKVVIDGLEFDGNMVNNTSGIGVYISSGLTGVEVRNSRFHDFKQYAIDVTSGERHKLINNTITNIGPQTNADTFDYAGIYFNGTPKYCLVQDNHVENVTNFGIAFSCAAGATGNKVVNNTVKNSSFVGLGQERADNHIIMGNMVTGCYDNACDLQNCKGAIISKNEFVGNGTGGVASRAGIFYGSDLASVYGEDFVISDNIITGNGKYGIQLSRARYGIVSNNFVRGNGDIGISIALEADAITVTGNEVKDNTGMGLFISAAVNTTISGNNIRNNGNQTNTLITKSALALNGGITVINATRVNISGNSVYDNSGAGIFIANDGGNWTTQIIVSGNSVYDTAKNLSGDVIPNTSQKYGLYVDTDYSGTANHSCSIILAIGNSFSNHYTADTFVGNSVGQCRLQDYSTGLNEYGSVYTSFDDAFNERNLLVLGNYNIWVDSLGKARIKNGAPTTDTDGTIIGTQA